MCLSSFHYLQGSYIIAHFLVLSSASSQVKALKLAAASLSFVINVSFTSVRSIHNVSALIAVLPTILIELFLVKFISYHLPFGLPLALK